MFEKLKLYREVKTFEQRGDEIKIIKNPLSEVISFHYARKSFITICLLKGINPIMVKKMSGHKKDVEFNKYIAFTNKDLIGEMKKWKK